MAEENKSKRKGFNFYNSYYETARLLNDSERLKFYDIMMERQFYGVEPKGLKGTLLLVWTSLKHSVDSQIKGFEDKTGLKLQNTENHTTIPPYDGGSIPPYEQEKEEVQVKEKGKEQVQLEGFEILDPYPFNEFWDMYDKKIDKVSCEKKYKKISLEEKQLIFETLPTYLLSTPDKKYRKNPETYLNNKAWNDEVIVSNSLTVASKKPNNLQILSEAYHDTSLEDKYRAMGD
jgi:hypothetical protein